MPNAVPDPTFPRIVLHLKSMHMDPALPGNHMALYRVIRQGAERRGVAVELRQQSADITAKTREITDGRFDDGNLHIIDDRNVVAPGVLNGGIAYSPEFWHLDPQGIKAFSSIGARRYNPDNIPWERAKPFFENLRSRYVKTRRTRYAAPRAKSTLPAGSIAVFFQGQFPILSGATRFSDLQMLDIARAGAGDLPIIVKPHPMATNRKALEAAEARARTDDRLLISEANLHDILAAARVTVSINSSVALEGFLHRTPAILLGKSDFHHHATTLEKPTGFAAALARETLRDGGYAKFLTWYFKRNCLWLRSGSLDRDIWRIFAKAGFAPALNRD